MITRSRIGSTLLMLAIVAIVAGGGPAVSAGKPAKGEFFGVLSKKDGVDLDSVRRILRGLESDCPEAEQRCHLTDELQQALFGSLNNDYLPLLVVYLDERSEVVTNRLIWKKRVTPFVYGVQNVMLLIVAEEPLALDTELVNLWARKRGVVQGLRDVFVSAGRRTAEDRDSRAVNKPIEMIPLAVLPPGDDNLWVARERFYVDTDAAYEIRIHPADEETSETVGFRQIHSRFTNSTSRSVDFGLGLGVTTNLDETEFDDSTGISGIRTGDSLLAGYWMLNVYVKRPILVKPIARRTGSRYRVSYGVTLGLNFDIFHVNQFVVGVNVGHLFGRHGVVAGVNFIDPFESGDEKSATKPFVAVAFNF